MLAEAAVAVAKAVLRVAQFNLGNITNRNRIDGPASVPEVSVGDLVTSGQSDSLATVTRLDLIYADLADTSARMLRLRSMFDARALQPGNPPGVMLILENGQTMGGEGQVISVGDQVLTSTGTSNRPVEFANPGRRALPGMFVSARLTAGNHQAALVPQVAASARSGRRLAPRVVENNEAVGVKVRETGANAVDTAEVVRAVLDDISGSLPAGMSIQIPYDTAPFVQLSIEAVFHTLSEAFVMVFMVMLMALQGWRAPPIPTLAVPVLLMGACGIVAIIGYSINTTTMFAMLLVIGLLVDDAIIGVENVERIMKEHGAGALTATEKRMDQITGALIGTTAVFLPMAFFGGATGVIYRQFSITFISAMMRPTICALTLTPGLCAVMLRPKKKQSVAPASWFNRWFERSQRSYISVLGGLRCVPVVGAAALAVTMGLAALMYQRLPVSFLPEEDQRVLMTMIALPGGANTAQTDAVMRDVETYLLRRNPRGRSRLRLAWLRLWRQNAKFGHAVQVKLRDYDESLATDERAATLPGIFPIPILFVIVRRVPPLP